MSESYSRTIALCQCVVCCMNPYRAVRTRISRSAVPLTGTVAVAVASRGDDKFCDDAFVHGQKILIFISSYIRAAAQHSSQSGLNVSYFQALLLSDPNVFFRLP